MITCGDLDGKGTACEWNFTVAIKRKCGRVTSGGTSESSRAKCAECWARWATR